MAYSFTEKKRIRKDFGKRPSILESPYLLEIQLDSFRRLQLLEDSDARVRQAAALLEATLADEKTVEALLGRLRIETVPAVRVGLLKALGKLKALSLLTALLTTG